MAIGRPMPPLILDDVERETLERWVRRPKTAQALALRARMILGCAEGRSNTTVGTDLGVSDETVGKWRSRFLERRLDGLSDEPRSGRPRAVTDDDVERVITLTLETAPRDATHWSTRSMAQRSGLSHNTVSRIWRAFGLQPHRTETFKLSSDPFFIEKVRDVVGLYLNPPDRALVLCVDEKSQIQALDRTRPLLPRQVERRTQVTALFAALDTRTGKVIASYRPPPSPYRTPHHFCQISRMKVRAFVPIPCRSLGQNSASRVPDPWWASQVRTWSSSCGSCLNNARTSWSMISRASLALVIMSSWYRSMGQSPGRMPVLELAAAALRTRALWKLRRIAPPVETMQRHPGSAPQVEHCTAAVRLLLRRG